MTMEHENPLEEYRSRLHCASIGNTMGATLEDLHSAAAFGLYA
jgi:hypothetical protein